MTASLTNAAARIASQKTNATASVRLADTIAPYIRSALPAHRDVVIVLAVLTVLAYHIRRALTVLSAPITAVIEANRIARQQCQELADRRAAALAYTNHHVPAYTIETAVPVLGDADVVAPVVTESAPVAVAIETARQVKPAKKDRKTTSKTIAKKTTTNKTTTTTRRAANKPTARPDYSKMTYRELQTAAKKAGIKANQTKAALLAALQANSAS